MGQIEINHTGSGGGVVLSSDGTDLLLGGSAIGGGAAAYTIDTKTANYTIVAGDLGKIIDVTANDVTLTLTAASTLGSGFFVHIRNTASTSTHEITIDPNGSETIDGMPTLTLRRNEGVQLVCDGSNFFSLKTVVNGLSTNFSERSSAGDAPEASGTEALALCIESNATGSRALAIGFQATASGDSSYAIGKQAQCTGTDADAIGNSSFASGDYSTALGGGHATGNNSLAISSSSFGQNSTASGDKSQAIGDYAVASAMQSLALGPYTDATGNYSVALGGSGTQSVGSNSVAIGNAYASGDTSFAASIANNTSSYGATGANSIAIGDRTKATGSYGVSIGRLNTVSGTNGAAAIGQSITLSGEGSFAAGSNVQCNSSHAQAFGQGASTSGIFGKFARACGFFGNYGDRQSGWYSLVSDTTSATPEAMTTNNSTAAATNQIVAASDTCITFSGTIVAMQNGAQAYGSWEIKGLLVNDGGTTTVPTSAITEISNTSSWGLALSADNTNNALKVQVTGEASHNIRWVANIQTSEVTYA